MKLRIIEGGEGVVYREVVRKPMIQCWVLVLQGFSVCVSRRLRADIEGLKVLGLGGFRV